MYNITESVQAMLEQRKSEISNCTVISESFGDYALSEDATNIRAKVNQIHENGTCSLEEMNEIITMVRESNLSLASQKNIVSKVYEMWTNSMDETAVTEGIFNLGNSTNRFDGDPAKNAEYIKLLNDMEAFITYMVDVMEGDFAVADDILKLFEDTAKKAKKKEDIEKLLSSCLNRMDKGNTVYNSSTYRKYYDLYLKFNKLSKSFNNRYSKITMAEKKSVDSKLDQILEKLSSGLIKDWFEFEDIGNKTPKTDRLNDAFLKIKEVDRDSAVNLSNRIISTLYKVLANSWGQTIGNVRYMRKILGIELEGTAKWKIVHKIFK